MKMSSEHHNKEAFRRGRSGRRWIRATNTLNCVARMEVDSSVPAWVLLCTLQTYRKNANSNNYRVTSLIVETAIVLHSITSLFSPDGENIRQATVVRQREFWREAVKLYGEMKMKYKNPIKSFLTRASIRTLASSHLFRCRYIKKCSTSAFVRKSD